MKPHGFSLDRRTGLLIAGERHDDAGVRPWSDEYVAYTGGPWDARVALQPVRTRTGTTYRVTAGWTGPPLAGSDPAELVQAQDLVDVDDQERAMRVARAAADLLRRPERPDLIALADQL